MIEYQSWVVVIKDFGIPVIGIGYSLWLTNYVLSTNRRDRKNQMKEQQDRWTYQRCYDGITAVFVMSVWEGMREWTEKVDPDQFLYKVALPIRANLASEYRFHNEKLENAWKTFYDGVKDIIEKAKEGKTATEEEGERYTMQVASFTEVVWEELGYVDARMSNE